VLGEVVTALAVRLHTDRPRPSTDVTSPGIFTRGDRFEVIWVYAAPDTTKVIDLKSVRHFIYEGFVGQAMGAALALFETAFAVSVAVDAALPKPTSIRVNHHSGADIILSLRLHGGPP
jgi:hypothetical protein